MIEQLRNELTGRDAAQMIQYISTKYGTQAVFSTSFGLEDQVITHLLWDVGAQSEIFTLDTGRLFPETYAVWQRTLQRYGLTIKTYFPNTESVERLITTKGPTSFYNSIDDRKECCYIRKIEPLHRALSGHKIWITGIRAEQSPNREEMDIMEWDAQNEIIKIHPLFDWSQEQVWDFVKRYQVPYNLLHDKGFPSIGCQPCTRAVAPHEDFRAGRWWWEEQSKKECGLHNSKVHITGI